MKNKNYYVYIITNKGNNVLYIGITSDLIKRVYEHKNKLADSFSKKYNLDKLVYFEIFDDPENAIKRGKQLKNWHRDWKLNLIKANNPGFKDLYDGIL